MNFFDNLFCITDDEEYSLSGLNKELLCINIYDTFIKKNKGVLVVASSTYNANLLYQILLNYTDKVLFFPMDDFLTSEAIAISPEFKVERINTLNILSNDSKYIVVTNLMGSLRYLPRKEVWQKSKLELVVGQEIDRDKLLDKLFSFGYERDVLVNGTGKIGVRGYVIDIFPVSYENPVRLEFWGDTIDSIKFFDVDSQLSLSSIKSVSIFPYTEFILDNDKKVEDKNRKQKYLKYYSDKCSILSDYLDNGIIYYYDYNTLIKSYSLLVDTILNYDSENKGSISTKYMNSIEDIRGKNYVYYYHFDDDISSSLKKYKYKYGTIKKYNGQYKQIKEDLLNYIKLGKTVILCINNSASAKRIVKYLNLEDDIVLSSGNIINNKINLLNKNIYEGFIFNDFVVLGDRDLFNTKNEIVKYKSKYRIGSRVSKLTLSVRASLTSSDVISTFLGRPSTRFLPFTSIAPSPSYG